MRENVYKVDDCVDIYIKLFDCTFWKYITIIPMDNMNYYITKHNLDKQQINFTLGQTWAVFAEITDNNIL